MGVCGSKPEVKQEAPAAQPPAAPAPQPPAAPAAVPSKPEAADPPKGVQIVPTGERSTVAVLPPWVKSSSLSMAPGEGMVQGSAGSNGTTYRNATADAVRMNLSEVRGPGRVPACARPVLAPTGAPLQQQRVSYMGQSMTRQPQLGQGSPTPWQPAAGCSDTTPAVAHQKVPWDGPMDPQHIDLFERSHRITAPSSSDSSTIHPHLDPQRTPCSWLELLCLQALSAGKAQTLATSTHLPLFPLCSSQT
jgi:hypothetical protein